MTFSSLTALCFFIPLCTALYFILWRISRKNTTLLNSFLLAASLLFYWWGAGLKTTQVIVVLVLVNYFLGYLIRTHTSSRTRYAATFLGVAFDVAVLAFFKYPAEVFTRLTSIEVIFPLGMSFIIFHCISYLVDLYKQQGDNPQKISHGELTEFINVALYFILWTKVAQGPIVLYRDMQPQLIERNVSLDRVSEGIYRFIIGLSKKVIIADYFATVLVSLDKASGALDVPTAWLGLIVYALQIYLDFSGYSDMAIGLSSIFGFNISENFNFPYKSTSIGEFWRRWHISLGAFFRNYIYIPLGGNRTGSVYLNLFVVFLLTGMWHGSTKIFVLWGVCHGLFVMAERTELYRKIRSKSRLFDVVGLIYTNLVVYIGWLCFRLPDLHAFGDYLKSLVGLQHLSNPVFTWQYFYSFKTLFFIVLVYVGMVLLSQSRVSEFLHKHRESQVFTIAKYSVAAALLFVDFILIVANGYSPFIYFQF